jgi:hypothetical protein
MDGGGGKGKALDDSSCAATAGGCIGVERVRIAEIWFGGLASGSYLVPEPNQGARTVRTYEKLDAWKSSHALTIAAYKAATEAPRSDPRLVRRICDLALRATAKVAFGSGTHSRRMFRAAIARSAGYLTELGYHLSLARVMGVLPEKVCIELDALRGRATFYSFELLEALMGPRRGKQD